MDPKALGTALTVTGFVITVLFASQMHYRKKFSDTEDHEAVITRLKRIKGQLSIYETVQIYAEYLVDGIPVKGYYYMPLMKDMVRFREGDTVTVSVNPSEPGVFMIKDIENSAEMDNVRKRTPIMVVCGLVCLIAGIAVLVSLS